MPSLGYVAWEKSAREYLQYVIGKWQDHVDFPLKQNLSIHALVIYKGQRPDLSGALESVGDCCEGYLWENDKQIISWDAKIIHDKENPRTIVNVREV